MNPIKHPVLFKETCVFCERKFNNESLVWSFGYPYHMVIHKECAPFFPFSKGYPHPMPYELYEQKSNQ